MASNEELVARGELWMRFAAAALPACIAEHDGRQPCTPAEWAGSIADEMIEIAKQRMREWASEAEEGE